MFYPLTLKINFPVENILYQVYIFHSYNIYIEDGKLKSVVVTFLNNMGLHTYLYYSNSHVVKFFHYKNFILDEKSTRCRIASACMFYLLVVKGT